jgi:hypothetical protein
LVACGKPSRSVSLSERQLLGDLFSVPSLRTITKLEITIEGSSTPFTYEGIRLIEFKSKLINGRLIGNDSRQAEVLNSKQIGTMQIIAEDAAASIGIYSDPKKVDSYILSFGMDRKGPLYFISSSELGWSKSHKQGDGR